MSSVRDFFHRGSSPLDPRVWLRDPVILTILFLGLLIRVVPLILFPQVECLRDECIYRTMALNIVDGLPALRWTEGE